MALPPIDHLLRELREELSRVNYLIGLLESMADGKNRRGRPPKFAATLRASRDSPLAKRDSRSSNKRKRH